MTVDLIVPKSNFNQVALSGKIMISETITGQIDAVFETNQCTLNMKTCERNPALNVKDMCSKLKQSLYSNIFSKVKPPLECPLQIGNYTITDSTFDLSFLRYLPLDGTVYVVSIKLVSIEAGSKKKNLVMCLNAEAKITKVRVKS
jgi:hypothetical protein